MGKAVDEKRAEAEREAVAQSLLPGCSTVEVCKTPYFYIVRDVGGQKVVARISMSVAVDVAKHCRVNIVRTQRRFNFGGQSGGTTRVDFRAEETPETCACFEQWRRDFKVHDLVFDCDVRRRDVVEADTRWFKCRLFHVLQYLNEVGNEPVDKLTEEAKAALPTCPAQAVADFVREEFVGFKEPAVDGDVNVTRES